MNFTNLLVMVCLCASMLCAQGPQSITWFAPPPPPVQSVTAGPASSGATSLLCYWIVAIYPIGKSGPGSPSCLNNVSIGGGKSIPVNWVNMPSATGYDVLVTTSTIFPQSAVCSGCRIQLNASAGPITDDGSTRVDYVVSRAAPGTATQQLNNIDFTQPVMQLSMPLQLQSASGLLFSDGTSLPTPSSMGSSRLPAYLFTGPVSWNTLDNIKPYFQNEFRLNNFPWNSVTAALGGAWPYAVHGIGADFPTNVNISGAGLALLHVAYRNNVATNAGVTNGYATALRRGETFCGVDTCATWGDTLLITDADRNAKLAAATSHSARWFMNEYDQHITNAGTGAGMQAFGLPNPNLASFITAITHGAGTIAHYGAFQDVTADYTGCFPGTSFAAPCITPDYSFYSGTRAASTALYVGPVAPGTSQASQLIEFHSLSGGGGDIAATVSLTSGGVQTVNVPTGGQHALQVNGATKFVVNGNISQAALLSQVTGGTLSVSSNTITPTANIHHVGAGLIKTITPPTGFTTGVIFIVPDSAYTYDATGNIVVPAGGGTATVNRLMVFAYDGTKWTPSY